MLNIDIDNIIDVFLQNEINNFNYVIHLDSLKSIFDFGILSRNRVEKVGFYTRDISKDPYQQYRKRIFKKFFPNDDVHNYVPLYISSHTPMMYPISSPYKKYYAVLKIDIFFIFSLEIDELIEIKISNTSINRKTINSSFKICNLIDVIDDLDDFLSWDLFNNNLQYIRSEKKQQKGAEILIPKPIAPQYISEVCPKCTQSDIKQKYKFSDEILHKMKFNNEEFKFEKEKGPELIFDFNNAHNDFDDNDFDDFFFEEEDEENDFDE